MDDKNSSISIRVLVVAVAVTIALWLGLGLVPRWLTCDWAEAGTMGDSFGAVNALFSGLAFGGVIYAILLQRSDLKMQYKELILSRRVLEDSAKAQQQSQEAQHEQASLMLASAKINALSNLIDAVNIELRRQKSQSSMEYQKLMKQHDRLVSDLQALYDEVNSAGRGDA